MLDIQRYADLGTMKIDWLDAHYHFSFANYHNPKRMGLGPLRVINDDIVSAGGGFAPHPHRDMEIITYVRAGAISHEDSLGNKGITAAGDIQVMSAGSGITHSEWNEEAVATRLYQIWIESREKGTPPRWEAKQFPKAEGALHLLASGQAGDDAKGALWINSDASIWGGVLKAGQVWSQPLSGAGYLLVSTGEVSIDGETLKKGDGVAITSAGVLTITANTASELVLIDLVHA
ncbi:MAG: pirin family protein [Rickettsiales bacterium]|nr:pirin family protein [Rickettsiales bacterium]